MLIDLIPKWEWDCWLTSTMKRQGSEQEIGGDIKIGGWLQLHLLLPLSASDWKRTSAWVCSLVCKKTSSTYVGQQFLLLLTHKAIAYKLFKRFFLEIIVILCIINALLDQVAARPK